ncbi:hypothetical protein [Cohnella sp. GCM10027633]|uniref:hypothetical protein n=1 Tax=unclassified Cohnella TaxID=2636738 RepID=UPI003625D6D9
MERMDSESMREKLERAKEKIRLLAKDTLRVQDREFVVMGIISPLLDELGADPAVIVGGHAVELYTSGSYKTVDIDIVMARDDLARQLFDRLGFERQGRFHYVTELDIPIEFPSDKLAGSLDRVVIEWVETNMSKE